MSNIIPTPDKDIEFVPVKQQASREDLISSLNRAGQLFGMGFLDYLASLAYTDKKVALKLLDKIVPDLKSQEIKVEQETTVSVTELIQKRRAIRDGSETQRVEREGAIEHTGARQIEHIEGEVSEFNESHSESCSESGEEQSHIQGRSEEALVSKEATLLSESIMELDKATSD